MVYETALLVLSGISIAILPFLVFSFYTNGRKWSLWKCFLFGWGGWLLALAIRIIPVQLPALIFQGQLSSNVALLLLYVAFASAMAGIFEEGMRYLFLDQRKHLRSSRESLLSFGLGWGIGEALILYVPSILALPFLSETIPSFLQILPGALERNIAIAAHLGLTFLVLQSVRGRGRPKKWLGLAMLLHFGLNMVSVSSLVLTQSAWLSELAGAAFTALILLISWRANHVFIRKTAYARNARPSPPSTPAAVCPV
jgi:uncharacterized membrane protein YhfC